MTMQMTKPAQPTFQSNWKTLFPDFTTLTGSCQFIKKLMAVSVSAITYLRGVFPEKAYGERSLCGIKLKLLTEESGIKAVDQFIDFVRSCYDAIDKKYLNQVSIGDAKESPFNLKILVNGENYSYASEICTDPENRDEVLESYNINFRYRDDEYGMSNKTSDVKLEERDPTVQATFMLLKSITYITDILGPIPEDAYLTMKLLFNDDITPADYQPQGFEPSQNEKFFFPPNAVKLELGKVSTEFNNYRMFLKTALSKEPLSQIYEESLLSGSQRSQNNENNVENEQENFSIPSPTKVPLKSPDFIDDVVTIKHEKGKVECICECKENSGTNILQCTVCGKRQHSVCYGFLNSHEVESEFYCTQCISEAPYKMSQDVIYTNESDDQKELSAMRRALVFCVDLKHVTPFQLERGLKCDKQLAKDMIAKLEVEGFVKKSGQKYIVNDKKIIKKGYWMYFRRTEDKENLESSEKTKPSPANASGDADFENERAVRNKKKSNIKTDKIVPEDEYMDFAIEDEVKKLNLKGPEEKLVHKVAKRRSSKTAVEDDSEETFQKKPRKRRCLNKNEIINLKE